LGERPKYRPGGRGYRLEKMGMVGTAAVNLGPGGRRHLTEGRGDSFVGGGLKAWGKSAQRPKPDYLREIGN